MSLFRAHFLFSLLLSHPHNLAKRILNRNIYFAIFVFYFCCASTFFGNVFPTHFDILLRLFIHFGYHQLLLVLLSLHHHHRHFILCVCAPFSQCQHRISYYVCIACTVLALVAQSIYFTSLASADCCWRAYCCRCDVVELSQQIEVDVYTDGARSVLLYPIKGGNAKTLRVKRKIKISLKITCIKPVSRGIKMENCFKLK